MCVIAVKEKGVKMFPDENIRNMFARNPDGAGIMWEEGGTVHIHKGMMKVEDVLSFVKTKDWTNLPVVMHFRIGTSGNKDGLNCHPYPIRKKNFIDGECDLAFAHNGILSSFNPPIRAKYNDTQNFNMKVLSKLPKNFLANEGVMNLLRAGISTNKLAFLDKTGKITLVGDFRKDREYQYSNLYWKPVTRPEMVWNNSYKNVSFDDSLWGHTAATTTSASTSANLGKKGDKLSFADKFKPVKGMIDTKYVTFKNVSDFSAACAEMVTKVWRSWDEDAPQYYDDNYSYEVDRNTLTIYRIKDEKPDYGDAPEFSFDNRFVEFSDEEAEICSSFEVQSEKDLDNIKEELDEKAELVADDEWSVGQYTYVYDSDEATLYRYEYCGEY